MPDKSTDKSFFRLGSLIILALVLFFYIINNINYRNNLQIQQTRLQTSTSKLQEEYNKLAVKRNSDLGQEIEAKKNANLIELVPPSDVQKLIDLIKNQNQVAPNPEAGNIGSNGTGGIVAR